MTVDPYMFGTREASVLNEAGEPVTQEMWDSLVCAHEVACQDLQQLQKQLRIKLPILDSGNAIPDTPRERC